MDEVSHMPKPEDRIKDIIAQDAKDEFISLLEKSSVLNMGESVKVKIGETNICPYQLLGWICNYSAVHCATSLLEGNLGLKLDMNLPIDGGATPLHEAASSLSNGLVRLFIRHGAQADIRCSAVDSEIAGMFPLQMAVQTVSNTINLNGWTPKHSVFKLVIMLCLSKMRKALETIKFLAKETKEIKEVMRHYGKEGKLVELAILMMVAQEKFKEPIIPQYDDDHICHPFVSAYAPGLEDLKPIKFKYKDGRVVEPFCMTFRQCIKIELAAIIEYEFGLLGKKKEKKLLKEKKEKKAAMISILVLLEIFERAGAAVEAYLQSQRTIVPKEQVAQELARILTEADFSLKSKDTDLSDILDGYPIKLESVSVYNEKSEGLCGTEEPSELGSQGQDENNPSYSRTGSFTYTKPLQRVPSMPICYPRGSPVTSFALRPFYPSWVLKAGFSSGFPKIISMQMNESSKGVEQYVRNSTASKRWFASALAVKRVIRSL